MNRISKAILIALAGLAAIVVVLIIAINLYVQSPGTQARIQEELSKALKLPLTITNSSLSPWSDLRINGITIPSSSGDNFLEASSFSARYRLLPFLRRQLVIYEMQIESPRIVWTQNAAGKWVLPTLAKAPANAAEKKTEKETRPPKAKKEGVEVSLNGFKVHNGTVELFDLEKKRVALLNDVEMDYSMMTSERIEGTITVGKLNYGDRFFFENVRSPFTYAGGELTLPELHALVAGGSLGGNFNLKTQEKASPFIAGVKFEKVDAARLSSEAGWAPGQAAGILAGSMDVHGSSRQIARAEGKGQISLANGQFRQLEFFQTIGQILQIEELANLRLNRADADFHIGSEKAYVDSFLLEAFDLKLTAQGVIRFDGKVILDARLAVNETLANKLPNIVRNTLSETDSDGLPVVPFKISGKVDRPKTDLAEKMIGKKLGDQFENVISSIFGGKKRPDDKKPDDKKKKKKKDAKLLEAPPAGTEFADPPSAAAPSPPLQPPGPPTPQNPQPPQNQNP
ncbi:MAG: hypothetical protein JWL90_2922 [Chthoniobacteraceae bacterium]|nr:hypothetical protein [Chthoniobacteraceae bacterium]